MRERESVARYQGFGVDRHGLWRDERRLRDVYTFDVRDWCNVIALTEDDELLLVWQWRYGTQAFSLETPGGVIDERETPEQAARRELMEETGYEAKTFETLVVTEPNPALHGNRCFSILARGASRVREPEGDELEECEVALVPSEHALRLVDGGHVRHALCQVGLRAFAGRRSIAT